MSIEARIERVFEPSHIRRGRLATSPTWFVVLPNGNRWRFRRKVDALEFVRAGCQCPTHTESVFGCSDCRGRDVTR